MKKTTTFIICFTLIIFTYLNSSGHRVSMVCDFNPNTSSSEPSHLTVFNNKMYFSAYNNSTHRYELWVYDGINFPTIVVDIYPNKDSYIPSSPSNLTVYNNKLYFSASDGIHGYELWVYDGLNPPTMVADIHPGTGNYSYYVSSSPSNLTVYNNKLYFRANDGAHGQELWMYDGFNPPSMVANINPHGAQSWPSNLAVFNGKLYFSADDGTHGSELWVYDGFNPPSMIADIHPNDGYFKSSYPSYLTVYKNKLYFRANDDIHGSELWVYDGFNPPQLAADICPGGWGSGPYNLTEFNNKLYFSADNGTHGGELWVYDSINHPTIVYDIWPGEHRSRLSNLNVFKNKLYFKANDGTHGYELWVYNGKNRPKMVADLYSGKKSFYPSNFCIFNNKLYFSACDMNHGFELFCYDGIKRPSMAVNINKNNHSSHPANLVVFKNCLYFSANNGRHGQELCKYDGTHNPLIVADINLNDRYTENIGMIIPPAMGSCPSYLTVFNNWLCFAALDSEEYDDGGDYPVNNELWTYDGINPLVLYDIHTGWDYYQGSHPSHMIEFKNKLYFYAYEDTFGAELRRFNGKNTPVLAADINPGPGSSREPDYYYHRNQNLEVFNGQLYFAADNGTTGSELWSFDGSNPPTMVVDIYPGKYGSWPSYLTVYNNKLYFSSNDGTHGYELWVYDGTNSPSMVADINPAENGSSPSNLTVFNNKLYFSANDGTYGKELWVYDGINFPIMVADINPDSEDKSPFVLKVFSGKLFFTANDGLHGNELWMYDGKNLPVMVADINPGSESSMGNRYYYVYTEDFAIFKNKLYFPVIDGIHGKELWVLEMDPDVSDDFPEINIIQPEDGTTVKKIINIKAEARDDMGIKEVRFYIDNIFIHKDTIAPYSFSWDTKPYFNGEHLIKAIAYDSISQQSKDEISVVVQNMTIDLQATKHTEKAWIIKKQYRKIRFTVNKFANIPIAYFIIYKKSDTGEYQDIKQITESDLLNGSYTFYEKHLGKNKTNTYKVVAKDSRNNIIAISNEVMVE